jgi:zinc finger protein
LTTVEGLIRAVATDLSTLGPVHQIYDEKGYKKIQDVVDKLKEILGDDKEEEEASAGGQVKTSLEKDSPMPQFTIQLDDPAGNSFVEFVGSMADPNWIFRTYHRTLERNTALGLVAPDDEAVPTALDEKNVQISGDEVFTFPGIQTRMKKVNIAYFKV